VLVVRSKQHSERIDLSRDKIGTVRVADIDYELEYPSAFVAADLHEKPTTPKAMLIVSREDR
jgi:hypothetical protein